MLIEPGVIIGLIRPSAGRLGIDGLHPFDARDEDRRDEGGRVLAHGPTAKVLTPQTLLSTFDTPFDTVHHAGRTLVIPQ